VFTECYVRKQFVMQEAISTEPPSNLALKMKFLGARLGSADTQVFVRGVLRDYPQFPSYMSGDIPATTAFFYNHLTFGAIQPR
jgi:hypothetical protein